MQRRAMLCVFAVCILLCGCATSTPLGDREEQLSPQVHRRAYDDLNTILQAFADGRATEQECANARRMYGAFMNARHKLAGVLEDARREGDTTLSAPGRRKDADCAIKDMIVFVSCLVSEAENVRRR